MEVDIHSDNQVHERDFGNEPWTDEGGFLSPISNATMDSERRSLTSPNQRAVHRRWTNPEDTPGSRASIRSIISRANLSDAGASTTESDKEKHEPIPQASAAVGEFKEFIHACQNVEKYLESFTHQVQKLGSAFGLVKASRDLHNILSKVRLYSEENAQTVGLLINKIKAAKSPKQAKKRKKRRGTSHVHSESGSSISENSQDSFIIALNTLARTVKKFTTAIIDFEDYSDEEGVKALQEFEIEVRLLSGGLEFFSPDGETHELRRFITARASSLKVHLDNLSEALHRFENIGIPCISFAQKRSSKMLLNAATVATFFAGVTATTLQYSVNLTSRPREIAMNTLWFVSLVLAIGAAITGMLAMTWRLAVFSSPKRQLPWYVRFWIRSGYLVLLIASVVAFLAGLAVYVFDTMPMTSFWIILACTVFCVTGLTMVSALFVKERYSFSVVRDEIRKELNPGRLSRIYERAEDGWWYWLRFHLFDQLREKRRRLVEQYTFDSKIPNAGKKAFHLRVMDFLRPCFPCYRRKLRRQTTQDSEAALGDAVDESKRPEPWKKSSRKPASAIHRTPHGHARRDGMRHQFSGDESLNSWYKNQLKHLHVNMCAPVDTRAVHLQFSPHGHWLVVCYKYECCVFKVESSFDYHTTLRHYRTNAKQVEWSPNGVRLLTRTKDSIKVWSKDQERFEYDATVYFDEFDEITDIQWLNDAEFLAIVDEWKFYRVNVSVEPATKTLYDPEPENLLLEIYYLYTLPDTELVVIAGARKIEELDEDKAIDCIIVYEMEVSKSFDNYESEGQGRIIKRIPLLNELESLSFGPYFDANQRRRRMVISYSDKPPEVWTVTLTLDENNKIHLGLEKELVKKMEPDEKQDGEAEWGEVFLIGPSQNVAACAEDGDMYFWDVEQPSLEQFHRLKIIAGNEEVEELPLVSWIGLGADSILPIMASAGKGLSLKIFAPEGTASMAADEKDNFHGPMDDGLTHAMRSGSNGSRLIVPSDSGIGQVLPKSTPVHTPPYPTIALPRTDTPHGTRATQVPESELDPALLHESLLADPDRDDDEERSDEKDSQLAPGSQYCTSPESSVKDDEVVVQVTTEE